MKDDVKEVKESLLSLEIAGRECEDLIVLLLGKANTLADEWIRVISIAGQVPKPQKGEYSVMTIQKASETLKMVYYERGYGCRCLLPREPNEIGMRFDLSIHKNKSITPVVFMDVQEVVDFCVKYPQIIRKSEELLKEISMTIRQGIC
jgi:hypothetical protein